MPKPLASLGYVTPPPTKKSGGWWVGASLVSQVKVNRAGAISVRITVEGSDGVVRAFASIRALEDALTAGGSSPYDHRPLVSQVFDAVQPHKPVAEARQQMVKRARALLQTVEDVAAGGLSWEDVLQRISEAKLREAWDRGVVRGVMSS